MNNHLNQRRAYYYLLAVAVVVALGGWGWMQWNRPAEVILAEALLGPMESFIEEDGKTRLKDRYVVSSPLYGTLLRIELKSGDVVEANKTLLATIQPTAPGLLDARQRALAEARKKSAELQIEQAQSNLVRALEALNLAEKNFGRISRLAETRSASQQELDSAQAEYRSQKAAYSISAIAENIARFELEQAEAAMLQFESENDRHKALNYTIPSPIDGRVLRVLQESSAVVQQGTPLLEVGDPRNIEVECDVLSSDAVKISEGNPVEILRWGGQENLHGKVHRVEPAAFTKISSLGIEEQRVNVLIDIEEPPEQRPSLGAAYRVEARIIYWKADRVLRIPASSLFRIEKDWAVYRVVGKIARAIRVQIGHRNPEYVEVLGGLEEGDVVVEFPSDQLTDGSLVRQARRK